MILSVVSMLALVCAIAGALILPDVRSSALIFAFASLVVLVLSVYLANEEMRTGALEAAERDRAAAERHRAETPARIEAEAEDEKRCRSDLRCWAGKGAKTATVYCRDPIERLAKYEFKWVD